MPTEKQVLRVEFPLGGRSDVNAYQNQPPFTTVAARNVWPLALNRQRGGARPGFTRAFTTMVSATPVSMGTITYISSGAIVSKLAVICSDGHVYVGDTTTLSSVGTVSVPADSVLTMCERNQQLFIATRETPAVYDPSDGTLTSLAGVNGGTVPVGCPCICCWRDRIVLAGGTTDPYGVFLSRQGDPEDWDYSKLDEGAAVNLALAYAGQIGETVTALIPHADSSLIIGCPTSLWMLDGDPNVGGTLVNLSQSIGIVDANAWCTTPDGMLVFLSADGLYMIDAAGNDRAPQSISREKLPIALLNIDNRVTSTGKVVSLAYDVRWRGIHIFLADRSATTTTTYYSGGGILHSVPANLSSSTSTSITNNVHWFLDWNTKSLFEVQFPTGSFDPWCCHARKNKPSSESVVVAGCLDGYVRSYVSTATTDDYGYATAVKFPSYVVMGPLSDDPDLSTDVRVDELELTLSTDSGDVVWTLYRGNSPAEALDNITGVQEAASGRAQAGRNPRAHPRATGTALYLMLSSTAQWAFESCRLLLSRLGRTRV